MLSCVVYGFWHSKRSSRRNDAMVVRVIEVFRDELEVPSDDLALAFRESERLLSDRVGGKVEFQIGHKESNVWDLLLKIEAEKDCDRYLIAPTKGLLIKTWQEIGGHKIEKDNARALHFLFNIYMQARGEARAYSFDGYLARLAQDYLSTLQRIKESPTWKHMESVGPPAWFSFTCWYEFLKQSKHPWYPGTISSYDMFITNVPIIDDAGITFSVKMGTGFLNGVPSLISTFPTYTDARIVRDIEGEIPAHQRWKVLSRIIAHEVNHTYGFYDWYHKKEQNCLSYNGPDFSAIERYEVLLKTDPCEIEREHYGLLLRAENVTWTEPCYEFIVDRQARMRWKC